MYIEIENVIKKQNKKLQGLLGTGLLQLLLVLKWPNAAIKTASHSKSHSNSLLLQPFEPFAAKAVI